MNRPLQPDSHRSTRLDDPQLEPIRTALERILHGHLP